jgi:two-component system cell cycle response regulator
MPARILVVDDLAPNRKLLEAKLKSQFYDVITAENGVEALHLLQENKPDIILMDVMMPQMNGFEACRRIKKDPKTADIPIIMVTALTDIDDRIQGLDAGADDFLTKPINDLPLFARIRSLVRLRNITNELRLRDETGAKLGSSSDLFTQVTTENSRILVIDEDASEAQQFVEALSSIHAQTEIATSQSDGVHASETGTFDVIIVNAQVGEHNGLNLCAHIRSQDKSRTTALLLLVEDNDTDTLVRGLDMGINDYLITPIDSNEIRARIRTQIRRKRYQDALKDSYKQSISLASIDGLTKLFNRRYFDVHIEAMLSQALANQRHLSFMILDIDHFKRVNDQHGHLGGDAVLQQIPERIVSSVRATDLVARYGGEEFAVIMPSTNIQQASAVAERIRSNIEKKPFILPGNSALSCTASLGVSTVHAEDSVANLIHRADRALYHVKETGRNRVAAYK